jgi:tetratricopeptide (TPR) repeat protein
MRKGRERMRTLIFLAAGLVTIALAPPVAAAGGNNDDDCSQAQDNDLSIAACTRVIEDTRQSRNWRAAAFSNRCTAYGRKHDYQRAIADCEEATRLTPRNASAWTNLGVARDESGDFDGALAAYDMAIRIDPRHVNAIANRGDTWREKGDLDQAIVDLDAALRLSPTDPTIYSDRAIVLRDKGDYDRAIADASEAVRLSPKFATAYAMRGDMWRLKGDLDQALRDQNSAIALEENSPLAFLARGDTYRYRGELTLALADYDRALELLPDYIPAYTGRGLTYEKMGDLAQARSEFQKALDSPSQIRADVARSGLETARARLAALDSGVAPPIIPPAPVKAASATSIPTPQPAVPAAVTAPRAKQGRRVALVIGNSGYTNVPVLSNPQHDADKIAATLRAIGFDTVALETNDTRETMISALRNFANEAESADWAMVYYAGHGIEVSGVNYLIPVDAKLAVDRDVQFEAVPLDQVMAALEGAKKLKLVLLDACRDNPFAPTMRHTAAPEVAENRSTAGGVIGTRSIGRGLGEIKVSGGTLVVYAAKGGEVALDGQGEDSPFAVAVIQRIATPGVEITKVFRLVRDDVMEATAGRQEPYTYGSLPGREDFYFVEK